MLEAKEMDFMVGAGVRSGYGEVSIRSTMYTSKEMVSTTECNSCRTGTKTINASRVVSRSDDVGLERLKAYI